ncbi:hypothetical protein DL770_005310 [Monosporascus sp. CRB-9-2]|nr:hypothetical protein DL770_005310 [Monosporascus sp. CRB-9-2]
MAGGWDPCLPEQFSDPDVTGIGSKVLTSFGISTLLAIAAILITYFTRALRQDRYNALDDVLVDGLSGLLRKPGGGRDEAAIAAQRTVTFETFIQAMADQQLFTGLSLIVAIYMVRYGVTGLDADVSAYSYSIAANLALLSCVTHLSTMTVLRSRLTKSKRLRDTRVFLMLVAIALLMPELVASQVLDSSFTLRCALDQFSGHPALLWNDIYDRTVSFATVTILGLLVCGYLRRLFELYFPMFKTSPEAWVAETFANVLGWPSAQAREAFNAHAIKYHVDLASALTNKNRPRSKVGRVARYRLVFGIVAAELSGSFFTEITWLLFYTSFSVFQIIFFIIWGPAPGTPDRPINLTLGFGQILPLVLLGQPFLSSWELYLGVKEKNQNAARNGQTNDAHRIDDTPSSRQITLLPGDSHACSNSMFLPLRAGRSELRLENISLYEVCLKQHRKLTLLGTWTMVVIYAVAVLFAAFICTGIIWSGPNAYQDEKLLRMGYVATLILFTVSLASMIFYILGLISWIWRGRYKRPLKAHSCEEFQLDEGAE